MKKSFTLAMLLTGCIIASCGQSGARQTGAAQFAAGQSSSGYTYKNLTIFLIRGENQISRTYLTLEEAMKQKKITLHETGSVGELSVDNTSQEYVFIMAGDIVKGGRQDRTMGEDVVLNPGAKKVPLQSFCVEQSRWSRRGNESAAEFASSEKTLNNKELKIAARTEKNQSRVWKEVADYQSKASEKVKSEVKSSTSPTSLQLTLENEQLKSSVKEYINALQPAFDDKKDVLGFAFFVNGKFSTTETFGNAELFSKLQGKLLESAANEAFEQYDESLKFSVPTEEMFNTFMEVAAKGAETSRETAKNMVEYTNKTDNNSIMLRSVNVDAGKAPLHTSVYSIEGMTQDNTETSSSYQYGGIRRNASNRN